MKTNTTRNATSNLGPLRLALLFTLLLITATPVTAAEIYVTTNTGTFGSPATLNRIYKYTVSGGVATPSIPSPLVTFSQASTTFLAVSGSQLFAARENVFPSFNDSIDVYNAITGASVKVPLVTGPKQRFRDVKVSGSHLFVAGSGSAIGEYNANTGALVNAVLAAVSFPQNMAVSPGPGGVVNLFVSSNNSGAATPGTGAIYKFTVSATGGVATPSTPSPLVSGLMFPTGIAVSPDGSKVFVLQDGPAPPPFSSDPTKSTISEYDANTGAPVKVPLVTGLNRPFDIAADESNLFVTLPVSGTIAEYDVNTGAPVKVPLVSGLSSPRGIEVEVSPLTASCDIFEEGTVSGFKGNNATLSFATPGPGGGSDHYLHTEDESGASYVVAPPRFNGNYTGLGTCSQICFDVQLFDDGDPNASVPRTPTLTLISGAQFATFVASPNLRITEPGGTNPGWHHVCAPVGPLQNGLPPSSQDGSWTISSGNSADWPAILANVTELRLPIFDSTPFQTEEAGYDNVCIVSRTCQSSTNKDLKNGTGLTVDNFEMTIEGRFNTMDWHFDGYLPSDTNAPPSKRHHGSFSFTPGSTTTLLRWTNIDPPVPPGEIFHAGFRVTGSSRILGLNWTSGSNIVGCAAQVAGGVNWTGDLPILLLTNNVGPCPLRKTYVGDVSVEWFYHEVALDQLNTTSTRSPIRTDSFPGSTVSIEAGGMTTLTFPLAPPENATYGMLRYTVSPSPTLDSPGDTIDFVEFGVEELPLTQIVQQCHGRVATIVGTPGNDIIRGTPGDDVIVGLGGNDVIDGLGGNDDICGGDGNDVIRTGSGDDLLDGGAGNNVLNAGAGNDVLIGGEGNDVLNGGNGNDSLDSGLGNDACNGGTGVDTAVNCEAVSGVP